MVTENNATKYCPQHRESEDAVRVEVWEKAIELAKSVECLEGFSGHWQNGHAQAKAVIIGLLEAALTKVNVPERETETTTVR